LTGEAASALGEEGAHLMVVAEREAALFLETEHRREFSDGIEDFLHELLANNLQAAIEFREVVGVSAQDARENRAWGSRSGSVKRSRTVVLVSPRASRWVFSNAAKGGRDGTARRGFEIEAHGDRC